MKCPNCGSELLAANINVQTDVASCSSCGNVFKLSESVHGGIAGPFDFNSPPSGAWFTKDFDNVVIGASVRSPIAFFLVPFLVVWSGGSLGGLFGMQIFKGEFNLFMTLVSIPFIIGSVFFWSLALMFVFGKVEVRFNKTEGEIFTGVGKIGIRKKFKWDEISVITESQSYSYNRRAESIQMDGQSRIRFGAMLSTDRKYFMKRAMQEMWIRIKTKRGF